MARCILPWRHRLRVPVLAFASLRNRPLDVRSGRRRTSEIGESVERWSALTLDLSRQWLCAYPRFRREKALTSEFGPLESDRLPGERKTGTKIRSSLGGRCCEVTNGSVGKSADVFLLFGRVRRLTGHRWPRCELDRPLNVLFDLIECFAKYVVVVIIRKYLNYRTLLG